MLTASKHDTAVTAAGHGNFFVGSMRAYERGRDGPYREKFLHVRAMANGSVPDAKCSPERIVWVDASDLIKDPKPGTGGGAHSGIYTSGIGVLSYTMIKACAS